MEAPCSPSLQRQNSLSSRNLREILVNSVRTGAIFQLVNSETTSAAATAGGTTASPNRNHHRLSPSATGNHHTHGGNALENLISIDFSSLEAQFEEIFIRLEQLEQQQQQQQSIQPSVTTTTMPTVVSTVVEEENNKKKTDQTPGEQEKKEEEEEDVPVSMTITSTQSLRVPRRRETVMEVAELTKEIETLRANQLRLKIDQELHTSTIKLEVETLRRKMEHLPQQLDLQNFRQHVDMQLTTTIKQITDQTSNLEHLVTKSLSEQMVEENKWKSMFENSIGSRIQDVWSGLQSSGRKLHEQVTNLQHLFNEKKHHLETLEMTLSTLEDIRLAKIEQENVDQQLQLDQHSVSLQTFQGLLSQVVSDLENTNTNVNTNQVQLTQRCDQIDQKIQQNQYLMEHFEKETRRLIADLTRRQNEFDVQLTNHEDHLTKMDSILSKNANEILHLQTLTTKMDLKLTGLDTRLTTQEKQLFQIATIFQETNAQNQLTFCELTNQLNEQKNHIQVNEEKSTSLQQELTETKQKVNDQLSSGLEDLKNQMTQVVSSEIPKLLLLCQDNTSEINKTRTSIRELGLFIEDCSSQTKRLEHQMIQEFSSIHHQFQENQQEKQIVHAKIQDLGNIFDKNRHATEENFKHDRQMIQQLSLLVDSLCVNENGLDEFESTITKFAIQCAEMGLKIEFFSKNMTIGTANFMKEDHKEELAFLLAKILKFLGTTIVIDQNKYLLTNQRQQQQHVHLDAVTQAVVMELTATQMLQQLQTNRIGFFMSKLIQLMNELSPIAPQNKSLLEIRQIFQKRVQYVIEFGIANLFPLKLQPKKPKKPLNITSTCVACDRPLLNEGDIVIQEEFTNKEDEYTKYMQLLQQEEQVLTHLEQQQSSPRIKNEEDSNTTKKTLSSSFMTTKIDSKTQVKGRTGGHVIRPKTAASTNNTVVSQETIHYGPGNPSEYIYRGGFRLPKNGLGTNMKTSSSCPQVGLAIGMTTNIIEIPTNTTTPTEVVQAIDQSAIEKVPLVGKNQQQSTSNTTSSSNNVVVPHPRTAPSHRKSLPRLPDQVVSSTNNKCN